MVVDQLQHYRKLLEYYPYTNHYAHYHDDQAKPGKEVEEG
jgi:hypothetical protein